MHIYHTLQIAIIYFAMATGWLLLEGEGVFMITYRIPHTIYYTLNVVNESSEYDLNPSKKASSHRQQGNCELAP